ncbi:helix-turn-helix transcriptional regulator [Blastomonas sp.]|uniref:helix-turn-helix transcriptional regulator n=1 Tax=Blastomonas sp. TaxID=1909299 RepID=UPI00391A0A17
MVGRKKADEKSADNPSARRQYVALPEPRFFDQPTAAAYFGISERSFEALWRSYKMPHPLRLGRRLVWDRKHLDRFADTISRINEER